MFNLLSKFLFRPHLFETFNNVVQKCGHGRELSSWVDVMKKKKSIEMDDCEYGTVKKEIEKFIPDLSEHNADIIKTNENSYIIQTDILPSENYAPSKEDKTISIMEANLDQKDNVLDPMPAFTTVEQRMIDLSANKLHPMYRRYLNNPKKTNALALGEKSTYKYRSGPINADEIPIQLNYNKSLLETKNLFAEYKRVEPPRQLIAKMAEINQNQKPTIQKKIPIDLTVEKEPISTKNIFDTLYQKEQKF